MTRRALSLAVALVFLVLAVSPAPAADPIKIGFLAPLSGIFAQAGKDMLDGLKMGLEASGGQVAGRKLELIEEDTEGNPATAQAKYRKLVQQDKINVLTGVLLANIGYALVQPIERDELPSLFFTTPDDLTKRKPPKWILRANFAASQPMHALGDYAAKTLKYKRVAALGMDNPFGHEQLGGFQRVFEDAGGRVVQKVVGAAERDGLRAVPGPGHARRRRGRASVRGRPGRALRQAVRRERPQGQAAADRHRRLHRRVGAALHGRRSRSAPWARSIWAPTLATPANQAFMKLAEARLKRTPAYFHAVMYSAGRWITEAARAVDGKVEDRARFLAAIRKASETTEDPRGPIKLDEYNNPTENVYILKVEKVGGRLQNAVIHTYPMVSQFWTYKPEDFLKAPAYDRNYPPVKP